MKFEDFKENGTEAATKAAGKYRQQGKTYTSSSVPDITAAKKAVKQ